MARLRLLRPSPPEPRPDVIETERMVLRPPTLADHRAWAELRGASEAFLRPWEPEWTTRELSRTTYRQRIRSQTGLVAAGRALPWFLFSRADDALLGGVTVSNIRRGVAQAGTLGYWMGEAYAGRGYMSEAVEAVVADAFDRHGLHRLEAATLATNARSIALLDRCGFEREGLARGYLCIEGRWQDHLLYGRVASSSPRYGGRD